jgi:hypothetical protein
MSTSVKMMCFPAEFRMPFRIENPFPMLRGLRSTTMLGISASRRRRIGNDSSRLPSSTMSTS